MQNKGCILNSCVRKEASQPNVPKKNCQETNHQPLNGKYEQAKRTLILMTDCDKKAGNPMHQTAHKSQCQYDSQRREHITPTLRIRNQVMGDIQRQLGEQSNGKGKALQSVPSHKTSFSDRQELMNT